MNPPTDQELAAEAVQALRQRGLHAYADAVEAQNNATGHYRRALRTVAELADTALAQGGFQRTRALETIRDQAKGIPS